MINDLAPFVPLLGLFGVYGKQRSPVVVQISVGGLDINWKSIRIEFVALV